MSSVVQTKTPEEPSDPKVVKDIIDKLKSQGLFDQFRKECLADVDTKPAYQNLRQRVEGHVSRFLVKQIWSPTLNKNQLRESLRRHMNQSGMLSNGVERIIEQVVNPKIFQVIKPKIDEVICKHLGIDPLERQKRLDQQKVLTRQKLPCIFGQSSTGQATHFTTPPPGNFAGVSQYQQDTLSPWQQQSPNPPPFSQPPGMNFTVPPPFSPMYSYPIPPQAFPYPPPGWNAGYPPFNVFPSQSIVSPQFHPPVTASTSQFTTPPPIPVANPQLALPSTALPTQITPNLSQTQQLCKEPPVPGTTDVHLESPFKKSLPAVSANLATLFAPIPTPVLTKSSIQTTETQPKNNQLTPTTSYNADIADAEEGEIIDDDYENLMQEAKDTVDDIPLPPKGSNNELENNIASATRKLFNVSGSSVPIESADNEDSQEMANKKIYNFAWDKVIEVDQLSELSVSTVHTSDLSGLDDGATSSDSDLEDFADTEKIQTLPEMEILVAEEISMVESENQVSDSDFVETSSEVSPIKAALLQPEPITKVLHPKPRKLISLQYNYSDNEDDETREERKARVAKEKEDRYLRRLQRRAEMEARRKEREEEKAQQREEKKAKQKEESEKKESTDSQESQTGTESDENKKEDKDEAEKEKSVRHRKTKAELKKELREQKVKEKKLALRRQRTRNKRYTSDEFTSIFTEKKQTICRQSYTEVVEENAEVMEVNTEVVEENAEVVEENTEVVEEEMLEIDVAVEQTVDISETDIIEDLYPVSPPTPTQDEQDVVDESETILSEQGGIPIIEVAACQPPTLTIGQTVYQTRVRSKASDDMHSNSSGRPGSVYGNISDISISESTEERKMGRKHPHEIVSQISEEPPSKKQTLISEEEPFLADSKNEEPRSDKAHSTKRYNTSDLYKPRTSFSSTRRRTTSPQTSPIDKKLSNEDEATTDSKLDLKEDSAAKKITGERRSSSSSNRRQRSASSGAESSRSSKHSRSPLSDGKRSRSTSQKRSPSQANSTVTISSESSEEERRALAKERERRDKTPIYYVDFGEAARRSLQNVSFGEAERRSRSGGFSEHDAMRGWPRGKQNFRSTQPVIGRDCRSPPLVHRRYSSDRSQSPPQREQSPPLPSNLIHESPPPMGLRSRRQPPVSPDFLEYPDRGCRSRSPVSRHNRSPSPLESVSSRDRRMMPRHTRSPSPMEPLSNRDRRIMHTSPPSPMRTRRRSSPILRPPSPVSLRETRRQRPPSPPLLAREGRLRPPSPPVPIRETRRQRPSTPPPPMRETRRSRPPSPPTMTLRETRRSRPPSPSAPVREMRSKRGVSPPLKRTKR